MRNRRLEVRPLAGALGAELYGVDLARIDDEDFAEIHAAWLQHLVVFFRDQELTPEQQIAFARRFGEIHHHPYMRGLDDHPEILEIVKNPGESYTFGSEWHSDQMFSPTPAKATLLYAKETPSAGGDTLFANMYLAYENLSDGMKALLARLKSHNLGNRSKRSHGGGARGDRYANSPSMRAKLKAPPADTPTEAVHPLVRTHPETGRKALYIGSHTHSLAGFAEAEADALIDFLRAHSTRPEFTCRFRWRPGSLAVWDNRCTQHNAIADYAERRRMHRITIAGDAPR